MRFSFSQATAILGLASFTAVQGQQASAYTDPHTGIDFQRFLSSRDLFSFGIALPSTAGSDFIGQIVGKLSDAGEWAAVSLNGGMLNSLLFVAWPDGENIKTSFRIIDSYANPNVYTATEVNALPIADGTFINSTHFSYTFLCQGCVLEDGTSLTAASPILGWAVSATGVDTPADAGSALSFHGAGYGQFGLSAAGARSSKFAQWAALASGTAPTNPAPGEGSGSNTTVPGSGTIPDPTVSNKTYDIIVVGGGTAGIIAAERLAESGASVLLLERGPANTVGLGSSQSLPWNSSLTAYDIPALGSSMTGLPGTSLCSDTASTAGCVLGGSSSINGLNFIHPPERDWTNWPTGWKWRDVSKAASRLYKRNPGTTQPSDDGKYYNDHAFQVLSGLVTAKGWTEVDSIRSPNDKHQIFSRPSWSIKDHLRAGPARTYIPFAQKLPNFTLRLGTKVIQTVRTGSTITGVLVAVEGGGREVINIKQGGKVVLAAGALSTPRVLWNSGIGRADALAIVKSGSYQTGVTLPAEADWIDLPVGHNLQDHAQVLLQFQDSTKFTAYNFNGIATSPVPSDLTLYSRGSGPITQAAQRMHLWTSVNGTDGRARYLQGTASAMADGILTVRTFLTHGTSTTGELGITASGNTVLNTKPWLIDEADRKAMSDFVQWWLDLTNDNTTSTIKYITPGATPADIISAKLVSGDHWVGSARMGTNKNSSVVDLNTKVYGTDNLFVVDASIHPDLPTGNTQSIIMITAEHASQKIAAFKVKKASKKSKTIGTRGEEDDGRLAKLRRAPRASIRQRRGM